MQRQNRIVIIGGGLSGMATAWRLADSGEQVLLLESSHPGSGASTINEGWLHSGGWFARTSRELAGLCHRGLEETLQQFPACVEPDSRGMLYLITAEGDAVDQWIAAWEQADIPFTGIPQSQTVERIPELRDPGTVRAFLLPDCAANFGVLLQDLHQRAVECGAEIREHSHVVRLLREDDRVTGVELADGSRLEAGTVILAGNAAGIDLLRLAAPECAGAQSSRECVSLRTHLLSLPKAPRRAAFCMPDEYGLHHLPHGDQSIFGLNRWQPVSDLTGETPDPREQERLRQRLFEVLDVAEPGSRILREWAGATVQAMRPEQIMPGEAPLPSVVDFSGENPHCHNLIAIFPGRATLWNSVGQQVLSLLQHS